MSEALQRSANAGTRVAQLLGSWFACCVLLLALSSCGGPGGSEGLAHGTPDSVSASGTEVEHPVGPLHPDTLLVDEEPCIESVTVSANREVIGLLLNCPSQAFGLEPGRIVLGSADGGYLRRIDSIETAEHGPVILNTRFATLSEAFTDIRIAGNWAFGAREVIDFSGRTLQGEQGGTSHISVASGSLTVQPELTVDVDLGFLRVNSATSILKVGLDVDMEGVFRHEASDENGGMIELQTIHHPLDVDAGPTSLQGELIMVIKLGYRNRSSGPGVARTAMRGSGTVELGGTWHRPESWMSHWAPSFSGEVLPLGVSGEGDWEGELAVQIEARIELQEVEGSTFRFEAYSGGSNGAGCEDKTWSSVGGLRGEAMMRLGFFEDGPRDEHMPDLAEVLEPMEGVLGAADGVCDEDPGGDDPGGDDPSGDNSGGDDPHSGDGSEAGTDESSAGDSAGSVAPACAETNPITCGATVSADTSSLLATALVDGYTDVVGNYEAAEEIYEWEATVSGPVEFRLVDPEPMVVDHDVIVLDASAQACLGGDFVAYGFHTAAFEAVAGTTYLLIVDGYSNDVGFFMAELDCSP